MGIWSHALRLPLRLDVICYNEDVSCASFFNRLANVQSKESY